MFRFKHNSKQSRRAGWKALTAATAVLALALVAQAAGPAAPAAPAGEITTEITTSATPTVGFFQLLSEKAESVYNGAQTLMNVFRLVHSGAESFKPNSPSQPSLLEGIESCSESQPKAVIPTTSQS